MALGEQNSGISARMSGVVDEINPAGAGNVVLVCEHASNFIPPEYHHLGLSEDLRASHIAWDPGAMPVALAMSATLDAPLVAQKVSRLLYDCNRPPEAQSAVPAVSEIHQVPGNADLSEGDRQARVERFYQPFRTALDASIARKIATGRPPVIVTIHSFTPLYKGVNRDVEIGILHDSDARLADAMLDAAKNETRFDVRRNVPYGPEDGVTHTLREHAIARGLMNAMIEIRNDLLIAPDGQREVADWLCANLGAALANLPVAAISPDASVDTSVGVGAIRETNALRGA